MPAPSVKPSDYLNGYSFSTSDHLVKLGTQNNSGPYKVIPELTDAEADATTGDIRKIFWGLCKMMYQSSNFVPSTSYPCGDPATPRAEYSASSTDPNRKTGGMTTSSFTNSDGSSSIDQPAYQTFTFTFKVVPTSVDVAPEA